MRGDDLRRDRRPHDAQQVLIRSGCQLGSTGGRAHGAHQAAQRCADAALDGEMQQFCDRRRAGNP